MSDFEKIIIPLIDPKIEKGDLSIDAGFIDSYTSDPDHPSGECELFLVYDDSVRTLESIKTARKFNLLKSKKSMYTKTSNGKYLYVYSFWINPTAKKVYNQYIYLNEEEKKRILSFWGLSDSISSKVLSGNMLCENNKHDMPLADYIPSQLE